MAASREDWLKGSPKKEIAKSKKPPTRTASFPAVNAWCIMTQITEDNGSITVTGKLMIFVQYDQEHQPPSGLQLLVAELNDKVSLLTTASYDPTLKRLSISVWRRQDANKAWSLALLAHTVQPLKDIKTAGGRTEADWKKFQRHAPSLDVSIDDAACTISISGNTLPLKPWIESDELGNSQYDRDTRAYEIYAPDSATHNAYLESLTALATEFGFMINRIWCTRNPETQNPCNCGCLGDWNTCGHNPHAFPYPVRRCLFFESRGTAAQPM